jgi:ubiquinone/menaquinone biosynthesis C-methylase UbiE
MNFDGIAPYYGLLESVTAGAAVHRCRTAFLPALEDARDILLLGEGNGRFLVELLRRWPNKRVTILDSSRRMMDLLQNRLRNESLATANIEFVNEDIRRWRPPKTAFDAIVTNFFLDCFSADELRVLISAIGRSARPEALWLVSDFTRPPQLLRSLRAAAILRMMYGFFRVTTHLSAHRLTPPDPFLEDAGFSLRERRKRNWGLLHSDIWIRTR